MFNLVTIHFYFIVISKSFVHCCTCNISALSNNNNTEPVKQNLDFQNLLSMTEPENEEETTITAEQRYETTISDNDKTLQNTTEMAEEINDNVYVVTETVTVDSITDVETTVSENYRNDLCFHFKNGEEIDFSGMVDVWETKYYQLKDPIPCFKILIRKTTKEERLQYTRMYDNLNLTVNWTNTILEIVSNALPKSVKRRHFLNGVREDQGILDNIIILENDDGNVTIIDESPDQWLITRNILLMRDCDSGSVVLFTRVPYKIRQQDMVDSLQQFGENGTTGKMFCEVWQDGEQDNDLNEELIDI